MSKPKIQGHHYDYKDSMESVAELLRSDEKYVSRLREAREKAQANPMRYATLRVRDKKYTIYYHSDSTFELQSFNGMNDRDDREKEELKQAA